MTDPTTLSADQILADFEHESLYARPAWFIDKMVSMDRGSRSLTTRVDTHALGALVDHQIVRPGHPKHFPGAVAVQLTGTLGQLWAIYGMGLRATDGWVGFGTHIHEARFTKLGEIGVPVYATATCTKQRQLRSTWFTTFTFRYEQEGALMYTSKQTAAWVRHTA